MQTMLRLRVPSIAVVIGEGSSGGALALGVADRVMMLENSTYSVISPEGGAAILWRDAGPARDAAAAFQPTAANCYRWGIADVVVPEPGGRRPPRPRRGGAPARRLPGPRRCATCGALSPAERGGCAASATGASAPTARSRPATRRRWRPAALDPAANGGAR